MTREAWGRWGAEDERGALNLIGPEQVRHAVSLVETGMVMSLAQPLGRRMAVPPHRPPFQHFMTRDGGDYAAGARRTGGFQFADDTVVMATHSGTHIDGLCHAWCDGQLYNGFPGDSVRSSGAARCGVDKFGPIVTRGVLLDFVRLNGGPLDNGASIGAEAVQAACAQAGVELRQGDAVLLRTGWQERHAEAAHVDFDTEPGIDAEAALWLAARDVAVVGADNFAVEAMPFATGAAFPVHQRLIRDYGVPLLEGLVLKPLAEAGAPRFLFMAAALPIVGGTGSPLTPVAVL